MSNMKEVWGAGGELDPGSRVGGEKRQFRDYQPPDYDARQRRRTDESFAIATQQVRCARHRRNCSCIAFTSAPARQSLHVRTCLLLLTLLRAGQHPVGRQGWALHY
jgi:hypothetical protein